MDDNSSAHPTRRTEILQAAASLLAQRGYQRATMKEIAARAGIAPGTIYLYFAGKREILSAIVQETETPMVAALLEMGELGDREALVGMIEKGLDITEAQLPFNRTLFSEVWVDDSILEESIAERIKQIHRLLKQYIAGRIAAGVFRPVDPSLAAQLVLGMFASLIVFDQGRIPKVRAKGITIPLVWHTQRFTGAIGFQQFSELTPK